MVPRSPWMTSVSREHLVQKRQLQRGHAFRQRPEARMSQITVSSRLSAGMLGCAGMLEHLIYQWGGT